MNRLDWYYRQKVTEAELDLGFTYVEDALKFALMINGFHGVIGGMEVTQAVVPDMTVRVAAGAAFDHVGNPIASLSEFPSVSVATDYNAVPTAVAAPGNEKYVAVFVEFDRALSDPRTDGNSLTVYFQRQEFYKFKIVQSPEAALGTATPVAADAGYGARLCDVHLIYGQSTVLNADIDITGREDAFTGESWSGTPTPLNIRRGTAKRAILDLQEAINNILTGSFTINASGVNYAGGPAWADGDTNPATSTEAQLDKIVDDLASTSSTPGAGKVGTKSQTSGATSVSGVNIDAQILEILALIDGVGGAGAITVAGPLPAWADATTVTTPDTLENVLAAITTALGGSGGTAKVGGATITQSPTSLAAGTLLAQLTAALTAINARATLTGGNAFIGIQQIQSTSDKNALLLDFDDPAGAYKKIFEFGSGATALVRFYTVNGGALLLTINANWTAGSSTWTRDVAAVLPTFYVFAPATFVVRRYAAGAGGSTFDDTADLQGTITIGPPYTSGAHNTTLDGNPGILISLGSVDVWFDERFYAAGADVFRFTGYFPKHFPGTPSSVTLGGTSDTNGTTGTFNAHVDSVTLTFTASGAGMCVSNTTATVS